MSDSSVRFGKKVPIGKLKFPCGNCRELTALEDLEEVKGHYHHWCPKCREENCECPKKAEI